MDISTLDGFLTSLIVGPDVVQAYEWMPVLWDSTDDNDFQWDSEAEAERIINLLIRLHNTIASTFAKDPENFGPYLLEDENGDPELEKWCDGFLSGMGMNPDSWQVLADTDDYDDLLYPLMIFGLEQGQEVRESEEFKQISLDSWVDTIIDAVIEIHAFFMERRNPVKPNTKTFLDIKIGRNDPCPCGSGKKFKHCCMN